MYCTNRNLARIMFGGEFVYAVLKVGWGEAGEPLKCPEEMGLVVVVMVKMVDLFF